MDGGAWQATVHGVAKSQDNLEEMGRFTENLSRLYQEEIEIMNNPITITESEAVIQNLTKNKSPVPDAFTGGFYQTFREELMPILLKLFQTISDEGTLLRGHHHPETKTRLRQHKKRKLQANITDECRCKNPQQNVSK